VCVCVCARMCLRVCVHVCVCVCVCVGVYVRGVHSTVTKHSDYFVLKDMSECVYRRWDDWILVTEFCVFEQLFF